MNQTQRIRLGLLLTNLKLGGRFSFRTYTADASYPKDPDPKNWRTINGSKVHLTNGKIDGGAGGKFKGNPWQGKKPHGHNSFFPPKGWVKKEPEPEPVPEPENEPVPFGSPGPAPSPTVSEKPPIGIINTMKGTFKNSTKEVQTDVSNFLKSGDINELPVFPDGVNMLNDELCKKAYNAWKNKMITKTAAQNIVAKAVGTPDSYIVKLAAESWGDVPAAPAKPKTAAPTPKLSTPTVTYNDLSMSEKDKVYNAMVDAMYNNDPHDVAKYSLNNAKPEWGEMAVALTKQYNSLPTPENQKELFDKLAQMYKGQYKASKEDLAVYKSWKANQTVTYNNLTSSEKDEINFAKLAVENGFSPEEIGALHLNNPKKEFAEMAVALIQHTTDNPSVEAFNDLHDKLAQIYKGQYKASKEDIAVYKEWKNNVASKIANDPHAKLKTEGAKSKAAGLLQTPNTCAYDFSNSGLKINKDTILPFAAEGLSSGIKILDPCIDNFQKQYDDPDLFKLTKTQKAAINRYKQGSGHIRDYLIYGQVRPGFTIAEIAKRADDISKGLKKMKHPDMVVTRGCSLMDWATPNNKAGISFEDLQDMAKTGETFNYKGFLSTGIGDTKSYGDSQVIRHIHVPEKARGGMINRTGSAFKDEEYEFLLDKETNFRIMKVEKDKDGQIHIYEEVVP